LVIYLCITPEDPQEEGGLTVFGMENMLPNMGKPMGPGGRGGLFPFLPVIDRKRMIPRPIAAASNSVGETKNGTPCSFRAIAELGSRKKCIVINVMNKRHGTKETRWC
jgi:hypothetical protein